jgi:hypothetical protein
MAFMNSINQVALNETVFREDRVELRSIQEGKEYFKKDLQLARFLPHFLISFGLRYSISYM